MVEIGCTVGELIGDHSNFFNNYLEVVTFYTKHIHDVWVVFILVNFKLRI